MRGRGGVSIEVDSECRVDDGTWRCAAPILDEAVVSHHSCLGLVQLLLCCDTVGPCVAALAIFQGYSVIRIDDRVSLDHGVGCF